MAEVLIFDLCYGDGVAMPLDEFRRALGLSNTQSLKDCVQVQDRGALRMLLRDALLLANAPSPRRRRGFNAAKLREGIKALNTIIAAAEVNAALTVLP